MRHYKTYFNFRWYSPTPEARVARGWTQTDLATYAAEALRAYYEDDIIRITPQHVSFLENNLGSRPDRTQAILKVLGMEDEKDV